VSRNDEAKHDDDKDEREEETDEKETESSSDEDKEEAAGDRDEAGDDDSADEESDEAEEDEPKKDKAASSKRRKRSSSKKRQRSEREAAEAKAVSNNKGDAPASVTSSRVIVFVAFALVAGTAFGWAMRDARAGESTSEPSTTSADPNAAPCEAWKDKICTETSAESAACAGAKAAAGMLSPATCNVALEDVPGTLERIQTARASCDELVSKLCEDLGKESKGCQLVEKKTPSIPAKGCEEMMSNYDKVLANLKRMGKRPPMRPGMGGPPGAGPRGAGPRGASPPGAGPRSMPPSASSAGH